MTDAPISFFDIAGQTERIRDRVSASMSRVLDHGRYIMGPEVFDFEDRLAAFSGARHAVSCSDGTAALMMALMALEVGPGDAVFVPSFTFVATAEAVVLVGATPVFVDVRPDTFNIDVDSLKAAIAETRLGDLRARAVVPVDLFGQPADWPAIAEVAKRHGLSLVDDAAQAFGATLDGRRIGTFGDATATSFFPTKPLGCFGDGGAVLTDSDDLAEKLRSIRTHGKGQDKYTNLRIGLNARLDTLQAAVLIEKMALFRQDLEVRQGIADYYTSGLRDWARTPTMMEGARSAWALYTLVLQDRESVKRACEKADIPVGIYYPLPLHLQAAYRDYPRAPAGCPVAEDFSRTALSLPIHPLISNLQQDRVIEAVRCGIGASDSSGQRGA